MTLQGIYACSNKKVVTYWNVAQYKIRFHGDLTECVLTSTAPRFVLSSYYVQELPFSGFLSWSFDPVHSHLGEFEPNPMAGGVSPGKHRLPVLSKVLSSSWNSNSLEQSPSQSEKYLSDPVGKLYLPKLRGSCSTEVAIHPLSWWSLIHGLCLVTLLCSKTPKHTLSTWNAAPIVRGPNHIS